MFTAPSKHPSMTEFLPQFIRENRLRCEMTLKELAKRSGVKLGILQSIESGRRKSSLPELIQICNALDNPKDSMQWKPLTPTED